MRQRNLCVVVISAVSVCGAVAALADTTLTFDAPVPGTIADTNGLGTGLTHRLPGTGAALPSYDPYLNLASNPGRLTITSTHADFNYNGVNLGELEAYGVFLPAVGTADIALSALFRDVHLSGLSDQLLLYAGAASNKLVRAGLHMDTVGMTGSIICNNGGLDDPVRLFMSGGGVATDGDDLLITFSRTMGLWSLAWDNLTNPAASGASPSFALPWLDDETSLYVGIHYANPGNTNPKTSQVDYFTATPEPTTLSLLLLGGLIVLRRR